MLTNEQIRTVLTNHRYTDKKTDLGHSLKTAEIDALCSYFESCKDDDDCNEHYIHTVADNVIKRRISIKRVEDN